MPTNNRYIIIYFGNKTIIDNLTEKIENIVFKPYTCQIYEKLIDATVLDSINIPKSIKLSNVAIYFIIIEIATSTLKLAN